MKHGLKWLSFGALAVTVFAGCEGVLGTFDVAPPVAIDNEAGVPTQGQQDASTSTDAGPVQHACTAATDCPDVPMQPAGCAYAECQDKKCVYIAYDKDGDGHAAGGCRADGRVVPGDDCADNDPGVFPGAACSKTPDGKDITFPNGTPLGACRAGAWDCKGGAPVCKGAVGPQPTENCTLHNDADCDGIPDNGCDCPSEGAVEACGNVKDLPAPCTKGTRTCTGGKWGDCIGNVEPMARDCSSVVDNDCNGQADQTEAACNCPGGIPQGKPGGCTVVGAQGQCANGTHLCQPGPDKQTGVFGACTGPAPGAKVCTSSLDYNCNGLSDNLEVGCGTPCLGGKGSMAAAQKFTDNMYGCAGKAGWDITKKSPPCASGWTLCSAATWVQYSRAFIKGKQAPTHKYWTSQHLGWGGTPTACFVPEAESASCGSASSMTVCPDVVPDPEGNTCNWTRCTYGGAAGANDHLGGCAGNNTAGALCCRIIIR